jgi:hypothetical protein
MVLKTPQSLGASHEQEPCGALVVRAGWLCWRRRKTRITIDQFSQSSRPGDADSNE